MLQIDPELLGQKADVRGIIGLNLNANRPGSALASIAYFTCLRTRLEKGPDYAVRRFAGRVVDLQDDFVFPPYRDIERLTFERFDR